MRRGVLGDGGVASNPVSNPVAGSVPPSTISPVAGSVPPAPAGPVFDVDFQACCHGDKRDKWTRFRCSINACASLRAT
eukprot:3990779-Heterocapsa_arctica.AAC.1